MPVPREVLCNGCGEALTVTIRRLDADGDLSVYVRPCETCMKSVADDAAKPLVSQLKEADDHVSELEDRIAELGR